MWTLCHRQTLVGSRDLFIEGAAVKLLNVLGLNGVLFSLVLPVGFGVNANI